MSNSEAGDFKSWILKNNEIILSIFGIFSFFSIHILSYSINVPESYWILYDPVFAANFLFTFFMYIAVSVFLARFVIILFLFAIAIIVFSIYNIYIYVRAFDFIAQSNAGNKSKKYELISKDLLKIGGKFQIYLKKSLDFQKYLLPFSSIVLFSMLYVKDFSIWLAGFAVFICSILFVCSYLVVGSLDGIRNQFKLLSISKMNPFIIYAILLAVLSISSASGFLRFKDAIYRNDVHIYADNTHYYADIVANLSSGLLIVQGNGDGVVFIPFSSLDVIEESSRK